MNRCSNVRLKISRNQWDWLESVTETLLFFRAVNRSLAQLGARTNSHSLNDADLNVLRRGILREEIGHSSHPAIQALGPPERDNDGVNPSGLCRDHSAFGIAGCAPVRSRVIGEQGQTFQVQIVFADAFVRFSRAASAKDHSAADVRRIVQTYRKTALDRNEIDGVHHRIDLRKTFTGYEPAKQRLRGTAVSCRVFAQSLVRLANGFHL